jgi:uncharacterized protein YbaA (DUF1428 family)
MGNYVDGFILPVPRKNMKTYTKWAKVASKLWMEYGALDYYECVGDDVPAGKITSFAKSVKLKKGEVVVFAWATYKSKKDRDRVMMKVMNDPRMQMDSETMPFDGMRMFWGGFKPIVKGVKKKSSKKKR